MGAKIALLRGSLREAELLFLHGSGLSSGSWTGQRGPTLRPLPFEPLPFEPLP